jgi:hypothetical protein
LDHSGRGFTRQHEQKKKMCGRTDAVYQKVNQILEGNYEKAATVSKWTPLIAASAKEPQSRECGPAPPTRISSSLAISMTQELAILYGMARQSEQNCEVLYNYPAKKAIDACQLMFSHPPSKTMRIPLQRPNLSTSRLRASSKSLVLRLTRRGPK